MTQQVSVFAGVHRYWERHRCPFCGSDVQLWRLRILSIYSFHCGSCGEVLEALDMVSDADGLTHIESHVRCRAGRDLDEPPQLVAL